MKLIGEDTEQNSGLKVGTETAVEYGVSGSCDALFQENEQAAFQLVQKGAQRIHKKINVSSEPLADTHAKQQAWGDITCLAKNTASTIQ